MLTLFVQPKYETLKWIYFRLSKVMLKTDSVLFIFKMSFSYGNI